MSRHLINAGKGLGVGLVVGIPYFAYRSGQIEKRRNARNCNSIGLDLDGLSLFVDCAGIVMISPFLGAASPYLLRFGMQYKKPLGAISIAIAIANGAYYFGRK